VLDPAGKSAKELMSWRILRGSYKFIYFNYVLIQNCQPSSQQVSTLDSNVLHREQLKYCCSLCFQVSKTDRLKDGTFESHTTFCAPDVQLGLPN
jgi:hypothetical protein